MTQVIIRDDDDGWAMSAVPRNRYGGPIPKFTDYHIWKTLMLLDTEVPLGRKRLASALAIGEGSVRTIVSILNDEKYIKIDRSGILLTNKGEQFREKVYFDVAEVVTSEVTINTCDCAVRVPYAAKRVTFGCEERDVAIKAGATGATTLVCKNGSLIFPGSDYPVSKNTESALREKFSINNDDIIIIGTSSDLDSAECGAVSAALNVIGGLNIEKGLRNIISSESTASELMSLAFAIHDLVGGYPVCAKTKNDLGIRIENGTVIDNAYTGDVLEEALDKGTTIRKRALTGPYKGIRVIVTPIDLNGKIIAAIGVVDVKGLVEDQNLNIFND